MPEPIVVNPNPGDDVEELKKKLIARLLVEQRLKDQAMPPGPDDRPRSFKDRFAAVAKALVDPKNEPAWERFLPIIGDIDTMLKTGRQILRGLDLATLPIVEAGISGLTAAGLSPRAAIRTSLAALPFSPVVPPINRAPTPEERERAARSLAEIRQFFRRPNVEIAGKLVEQFEGRPFMEQMFFGVAFDPLNWVPFGLVARAGGQLGRAGGRLGRAAGRLGRAVPEQAHTAVEGLWRAVRPARAPVIEYEGLDGRPMRFMSDPSGMLQEMAPHPGPGAGVPGAASDPQRVRTGVTNILSRIIIEERRGHISPQTAQAARLFVEMLPSDLLDDLAISFSRKGPQGVEGLYVPGTRANPAIVNIFYRTLEQAVEPERVILHEISHHLTWFVSNQDLYKLFLQFDHEQKSRQARKLLKRVEELADKPYEALTPAERQELDRAYRYSNFTEWVAEVLSERGLRDVRRMLPEYEPIWKRLFAWVRGLGIASYNFLLRMGRPDHAERVYRKLIRGEYEAGPGGKPLRGPTRPLLRAVHGEDPTINLLRIAESEPLSISKIQAAINAGRGAARSIKNSLLNMGLIDKVGRITNEGRQVLAGTPVSTSTASTAETTRSRWNAINTALERLRAFASDPTATLKGYAPYDALRDRALIEVALATGARPIDIEKLTIKELRDFLTSGTIIGQTEQGVQAQRVIRMIPERQARAVQAVQEYLDKRQQLFPKHMTNDSRAWTIPGRDTTRVGINRALRSLESAFPDLDIPVKALAPGGKTPLRKLVAWYLKELDPSLVRAQEQLGHASWDVTLRAYIEEVGLEPAEIADLLNRVAQATGAVDLTTAQSLNEILKRAGSVRRVKGAVVGAAQAEELTRTFGREAEAAVVLTQFQTARLNLMPDQAKALYERGLRLESLRLLATRLDRLSEELTKQVRAVGKFLADAKKRGDPGDIATASRARAALIAANSDARAVHRAIEEYLRTAHREWWHVVTQSGLADTEFQTVLDAIMPGTYLVRQAADAKAHAARMRKIRDDLRRRVGVRSELDNVSMEQSDIKAIAPVVRNWLHQPAVKELLEGKHLDGTIQSAGELTKILKSAAKTAPAAFGSDFAKLDAAARTSRIKAIVSAMILHPDMYQDFVGKRVHDVAEALAEKAVVHKSPVKRAIVDIPEREPDPAIPHIDGWIKRPDVDHCRSMIRTGMAFLRPGQGGWLALGRALARPIVSTVGGGQAPFLFPVTAIIRAYTECRRQARVIGDNVAIAVSARFRRSGVLLERHPDEFLWGGGITFFRPADDQGNTIIRVKKLWEPLAELKRYFPNRLPGGTKTVDDMMYNWDVLYSIPPNLLDDYYEFASDRVRDAILYPHRIIQRTEEIMEEAKRAGVDITSKFSVRIWESESGQAYMPRLTRRTGFPPNATYYETLRRLKSDSALIIQDPDATHFQPRRHEDIAMAIQDATVYEDGPESLAHYVYSILDTIAYEQATLKIREIVPKFGGAETPAKALRAAVRAAEALRDGRMPDPEELVYVANQWPGIMDLIQNGQYDEAIRAAQERLPTAQRDYAYLRAMKTRSQVFSTRMLEDMLLTQAEADQILQHVQIPSLRYPTGWIAWLARGLRPIARGMVFLKTGIDFGVLASVGQNSFWVHPTAWMKAWGHLAKSFLDPKFHDDWRALEVDTVGEINRLGGNFGRSEITEYAGAGVVLETAEKIAVERGMSRRGRRVLGQLADKISLTAFQRSFDATIEFLLVQLYKAFKTEIVRSGGGEVELRELVASLSKIRGTFNTHLTAMTPLQQLVESTFLFFAPLFRRASYGLIGDLFIPSTGKVNVRVMGVRTPLRLGTRRALALSTLGSLLAGMGALASLAYLAGNRDAFNPRSGRKFMSFRVGDTYIGFPSVYMTLARLAWNLTTSEGRAAAVRADFDNSLFRFWRGMSSPLTSMTLDLMQGEDYLGDPIRGQTVNMIDITNRLWVTIAPFWVIWPLDDINVGELFGLNVRRATTFDHLDALRSYIQKTDPDMAPYRNARWDSIPVLVRNQVEKKYPELAALTEQFRTEQAARSEFSALQRSMMQEFEARRRVVVEHEKRIARQFETGQMSGRRFRDELTQLAAATRAVYAAIENNPKYAPVLAEIRRQRSNPAHERFYGDVLFDLYMETVVRAPEVYDAEGNYIPEMARYLDERFRNSVGEIYYRYVRERLRSHESPAIVAEFYRARELLDQYWRAHELNWGANARTTQIVNEILELRRMGWPESEIFARRPSWRRIWRRFERLRTQVRRRNPEIDKALVLFYDYRPLTPAGRKAEQERRKLAATSTPAPQMDIIQTAGFGPPEPEPNRPPAPGVPRR